MFDALLITILVIIGVPTLCYMIGRYVAVGFFSGKEFWKDKKKNRN